jgi:hypothetical protein
LVTDKTSQDRLSQRLLSLIEKEIKFLQGMEKFNKDQIESMCNVKNTSELDEKYRSIKNNRENINVSLETVGHYLSIGAESLKLEAKVEEKSRDCVDIDDDRTEREPNYLETCRKGDF